MTESGADGDAGIQRKWLYTNAPRTLHHISDHPYYHINLDTWYYALWEAPNQSVMLGALDLGERPLTAAQGVGTFIAYQVAAFRDAFADIFHPTVVRVNYKPQLSGVVGSLFEFPAPETQEDVQAIQTALERSAYEGITGLTIPFSMWATIRDDSGRLTDVWLPAAGQVWYPVEYTAGYISTPPIVTYLLTPSAKAGLAHWTVDLECNVASLFRRTNAPALALARGGWRKWLQTHPIGVESGDEDDGRSGDDEEEWDGDGDGIITLMNPPLGTPPDNQELYERNMPRLRAAVKRWEEALGVSFAWSGTL